MSVQKKEMKMSRKIEVCVKCKREYDGYYPCPCGGVEFEELKKEKEDEILKMWRRNLWEYLS